MGSSRKPTEQDTRIGGILRRYREKAGHSQAYLAARLGLTHQQLGKYERGESALRFSMVERIAVLYGLPIETFAAPETSRGFFEPEASYEPVPVRDGIADALAQLREVVTILETLPRHAPG